MITISITLLLFFLIGSIPTGLAVGKLYGCDLRQTGSKNIGATNALRTLGKKAGLLTFIGDVLKGLIPVLLISISPIDESILRLLPFFGLATIIGHCFSPFLNFNGGKGVATSLGVFIALIPLYTIAAVLVFALIVKKSGYVSLGSICAISFAAIATAIDSNCAAELQLAILIAAILVIARHKKNIVRLINKEELPYSSSTEKTA